MSRRALRERERALAASRGESPDAGVTSSASVGSAGSVSDAPLDAPGGEWTSSWSAPSPGSVASTSSVSDASAVSAASAASVSSAASAPSAFSAPSVASGASVSSAMTGPVDRPLTRRELRELRRAEEEAEAARAEVAPSSDIAADASPEPKPEPEPELPETVEAPPPAYIPPHAVTASPEPMAEPVSSVPPAPLVEPVSEPEANAGSSAGFDFSAAVAEYDELLRQQSVTGSAPEPVRHTFPGDLLEPPRDEAEEASPHDVTDPAASAASAESATFSAWQARPAPQTEAETEPESAPEETESARSVLTEPQREPIEAWSDEPVYVAPEPVVPENVQVVSADALPAVADADEAAVAEHIEAGIDLLSPLTAIEPEPTSAAEPGKFVPSPGHWSHIPDEDDVTEVSPSRDVGVSQVLTTSALVIPSLPSSPVGPVSGTGEILVTGTIDLPSMLGATGVHPARYDRSDVDVSLEAGDREDAMPMSAPVRAVRAVSTHTSTQGMIAPKRSRARVPTMVLAIAAAVMGVGVVVLFVGGMLLDLF